MLLRVATYILLVTPLAQADVGALKESLPNGVSLTRSANAIDCTFYSSVDENLIPTVGDQFSIILQSTREKKIVEKEIVYFQTFLKQHPSDDKATIPVSGTLTLEATWSDVVIHGYVRILNSFLGEVEVLKHDVPSIYIETFLFFKDRKRNLEFGTFAKDRKWKDSPIGGGLLCFPRTRFVNPSEALVPDPTPSFKREIPGFAKTSE